MVYFNDKHVSIDILKLHNLHVDALMLECVQDSEDITSAISNKYNAKCEQEGFDPDELWHFMMKNFEKINEAIYVHNAVADLFKHYQEALRIHNELKEHDSDKANEQAEIAKDTMLIIKGRCEKVGLDPEYVIDELQKEFERKSIAK
jgi:hypothetical protein